MPKAKSFHQPSSSSIGGLALISGSRGSLQLRRITTSGRWIPEVDGLRFVAILAVICFHIWGQTSHVIGPAASAHYALFTAILGNGDRGVPLFFVISGYILSRPFLEQHLLGGRKVSLSAYFIRRITRLEPPYIASLLLFTAAFMVYPGVPFQQQLPHLVASTFYVHGFTFGTISTINFVAWSLEIEVQFYVVAPLLGMLFAVRNSIGRRSLLVALMLFCGSFHLWAHGLWLMTVFNYGHFFLAGFLLADLMTSWPRKQHRKGQHDIAWDLVGLVGWPTIFLLPRVDATMQFLPFLILPVFLSAFYGRIGNWIFRREAIALTGGMCYSFYLIHMLVISVAFKATRHLLRFDDLLLNYAIQFVALSLCIYPICTLFFVLIERPCMERNWPQKLWSRLRGAPVPEQVG